jgi:hypothetical protein
MHDEMAGFYEVRIQGGGMNYRLFCVLERDVADLGGSSIVVIVGLSKPKRSAADPKDYRLRAELGLIILVSAPWLAGIGPLDLRDAEPRLVE